MRVVFCLFADDTGIFEPRDIFLDFLENRSSEDGADLGLWLSQLFQVLDTPESERQRTLDEDLVRFPYVNGDLFDGSLRIPSFNAAMRGALLDACRCDWSEISPAIFGALFQSVMNPEERRAHGAHYTTEKNILKVIEPLFMDDLCAEFARLKSRKDSRRVAELRRFQERLSEMAFFDPACGCGNFLIIAYRELRMLEIKVLKQIHPKSPDGRQTDMLAETLSLIDVDQFYGIELGEFPAHIAETAMWMMDHIMNNRLSLEFGQTYVRIPLQKSPHIVHGDALEADWTELLPPKECSFVFGNPPFVGAKYQTVEQRAQVAQLWPILFNRCRLEIAFAHRTFAWGSDARGKAHVHVVILGLDRREVTRPSKRLFNYSDTNGEPEESRHAVLSPYLFDASRLIDPQLTVREESGSINGMGKLITGTQPLEDGNLTFSNEGRAAFLEREPASAQFFRPFPGAREFIRGDERWILHTAGIPPQRLHNLPMVVERLKAVSEFRAKSKRQTTSRLADYPSAYGVTVVPDCAFLIVPQTSSERRDYVPIGWLEPPTIPSEKLRLLLNASLADFALLTSIMHMDWMRAVTGRMKSDYMYSVGVVYNTFPTPPGFASGNANLSKLEPLAQAVLDARTAHPDATLDDLYDPNLMPPNLRRAHQALDRAVDKLYRRTGFASERERVDHLFMLYKEMRTSL